MPQFYLPENYTEVCAWYYKRDMQAPRKEVMPTTGVIVPNLAAAFLLGSEGPYCFIEGAITNPDAPEAARNQALKACIKRVMEIAKARGYEQIVGMTKVQRIVDEYAKHFNFKVMGEYTMVVKQL